MTNRRHLTIFCLETCHSYPLQPYTYTAIDLDVMRGPKTGNQTLHMEEAEAWAQCKRRIGVVMAKWKRQ